jgi:tetratricopeptide (TPR) repeat protein
LEVFLKAAINPDKKKPEKAPQSHYVTLGVEKNAAETEIKRAYFQLVRTYQPDQFPEEFKKIRAAYETLIDPEKRAEYDEVCDLPDSIAGTYREAVRLSHSAVDKAIGLYGTILQTHPNQSKVLESYAEALEIQDKYGKAGEVWEKLTKQYPDNAKYARNLADCYLDRGWHKKAYNEAQRAVTLAPDDVENWIMLLDCMGCGKDPVDSMKEMRDVSTRAIQAIQAVKTNEWKKIHVYTIAFVAHVPDGYEKTVSYLREVVRLVRENGRDGQKDGKTALREIMRTLPPSILAVFYPELKELASLLPGIQNSPIMDDIDDIRVDAEVNNLEKEGFDKIFPALFHTLNSTFNDIEDEMELLTIEYALLHGKHIYDPQVRRLKKEYPEIYALHSSFFNEMLRTRDPDKLIYARAKKLGKLERESGISYDSDEPVDMPVRRETPKVGRNDPCPCGSGKKYKKCCGA